MTQALAAMGGDGRRQDVASAIASAVASGEGCGVVKLPGRSLVRLANA